MLDPVEPSGFFPMFRTALTALDERGGLISFRRLGGRVLIALDGTEYFKSQKLSCPNCQTRKRNNGQEEQYHSMLCATIVAPGHTRVLPLEPEFITPQDGHKKQDCENAAVKRWLAEYGPEYARLKPVYLGDDLMSRQPICKAVQGLNANFIFTAKATSHQTLYEWIGGAELQTFKKKVKKSGKFVTHHYRWIKDIPLRDGEDAMPVNWFEIEIIDSAGKRTYRGSFVTDLDVDEDNIAELVDCARTRWKIENEEFNTLKTKGYNLEHNFGHGKQHLSSTLATLNLIAFAFHTVCDLVGKLWKQARDVIGTRKRFFEELRSITRYILFPDWATLIRTMITGEPPPNLLAR
jgi:hypothetical protein